MIYINIDKFHDYPSNFPKKIDLKKIKDPFTLSTLHDLSQQAFKAMMPYYTFGVAQLKGENYAYYDAVCYRLSKHNNMPTVNLDPCTRLKIEQVFYFSISNPVNLKSNIELINKANAYPNPCYLKLNNVFTSLSEEKIIQYAFSALNFHVLDDENSKNIECLKNIINVIFKALKLASEQTEEVSLKSEWIKEAKKWEILLNKND